MQRPDTKRGRLSAVMRPVALFWLSVTAVSVACGGRSQLEGMPGSAGGGVAPGGVGGQDSPIGGSPSGAGGLPSSGGAGAGSGGQAGSGGSAGQLGSCATFTPRTARRVVPYWNTDSEFEPRLVLAGNDESAVALAFRAHKSKLFATPPIEGWGWLANLTFSPWATWSSADLETAEIGASAVSWSDFAQGSSPAAAHALLYRAAGLSEPSERMYFAPDLVPGGKATNTLLNAPGKRALFVAGGGGHHLLGFERLIAEGHHALTFGRFAQGAFSAEGASGCATAPLAADALWSPNGYLLALSTSRPFGTCADAGADGPPTRLEIARLAEGSVQPQLREGFDVGAPVAQVRLVRRPQGAWLLWRVSGSAQAGAVSALRLGPTGKAIGAPMEVVPSGSATKGFTTASLGERLVVLWSDGVEPPLARVSLRAFDESGVVSSASWVPVPPLRQIGLPALVGSPDGAALVMAWTGDDGSTGVFVSRLDCMP